jgi:hypothetical protein
MLAFALAMVISSGHPPAPLPEEVYCLVVEIAWDGHKVKAGRWPVYGIEVPNVKYERGHEPERSTGYPLSPFPLVSLERLFEEDSGRSIELLTQPALPLGAGRLTVTVRVEVSPRFPAAKYPKLATSAKQAVRRIQFVEPIVEKVSENGIQMSWRVLHAGTAAPGSPVSFSFELGPFVAPAPSLPERAVLIGRGGRQIEISITRPANQDWTFDWREPPSPGGSTGSRDGSIDRSPPSRW